MPCQKHENRLKDFLDDGWEKFRFKRNIKKWGKEIEDGGVIEVADEHSFIPDGFKIDKKNKIIHILEIENKNPLSDTKIHNLAMYWFGMDCYSIGVELTVATLYGQYFVNLCNVFYKTIIEHKSPNPEYFKNMFKKEMEQDATTKN